MVKTVFVCILFLLFFSVSLAKDSQSASQVVAGYQHQIGSLRKGQVLQRCQVAHQAIADLERLGYYAEAVKFCDAGLAQARSTFPSTDNALEIDHEELTFLMLRVDIAQKAGDPVLARASIAEILRLYPEMPEAAEAMLIRAQLDGEGVAEAQAALAKNEELSASVNWMRPRSSIATDIRRGIQTLSDIASAYPDLPASLEALKKKAAMHQALKEWGPQAACYRDILRKMSDSAESKIGFKALEGVVLATMRDVESRSATKEELADLRALATRLINLLEPSVAVELKRPLACGYLVRVSAESQLRIAFCYYGEGNPTKSLQAAEQLIAKYQGKGCTKNSVAWAHFYAGLSLEKMGRAPDAFNHYDQVIDLHKARPFKQNEMDVVRAAAVRLAKMGKVWTSGPFD